MNAMEGRSAGTATSDSNVAWVRPESRATDPVASLARLFVASAVPVYICDAAGVIVLKNSAFDAIATSHYGADKARPEDTPPGIMRLL